MPLGLLLSLPTVGHLVNVRVSDFCEDNDTKITFGHSGAAPPMVSTGCGPHLCTPPVKPLMSSHCLRFSRSNVILQSDDQSLNRADEQVYLIHIINFATDFQKMYLLKK